MKHCIDIYTGWIVAFVDGQWRHAHIEPGWVTFALWSEPNQHLGVCRKEDLSLKGAKDVVDLAVSPHVLVGPPVLDEDWVKRLGSVRFGRKKTLRPEFYSVKDLHPAICADFDNQDGIPLRGPTLGSPETPRRWTRTARSLVIS